MSGHVPERRCVGCGRHAPKSALARFVTQTAPDGVRLLRDRSGGAQGRGVYVCPDRACFEQAIQRRAFQRGLRLSGGRLLVDATLADEFDL